MKKNKKKAFWRSVASLIAIFVIFLVVLAIGIIFWKFVSAHLLLTIVGGGLIIIILIFLGVITFKDVLDKLKDIFT